MKEPLRATFTEISPSRLINGKRRATFLVVTSDGQAFQVKTATFTGIAALKASRVDRCPQYQLRVALIREMNRTDITPDEVDLIATTKPKKVIG